MEDIFKFLLLAGVIIVGIVKSLKKQLIIQKINVLSLLHNRLPKQFRMLFPCLRRGATYSHRKISSNRQQLRRNLLLLHKNQRTRKSISHSLAPKITLHNRIPNLNRVTRIFLHLPFLRNSQKAKRTLLSTP